MRNVDCPFLGFDDSRVERATAKIINKPVGFFLIHMKAVQTDSFCRLKWTSTLHKRGRVLIDAVPLADTDAFFNPSPDFDGFRQRQC